MRFILLFIFILLKAQVIAIDLPFEVYNLIKPGDIIVRKGGGPLSYQLMQYSHENYSHCGIIVSQNNRLKVIESRESDKTHAFDGVQINPISDFVKYTADSSLFICRFKNKEKNQQFAARAFYYLDLKIEFDHRFNLEDKTQFYCTELLIEIFYDVLGYNPIKVIPQHKTFIPLFASFFDETQFEIIYQMK